MKKQNHPFLTAQEVAASIVQAAKDAVQTFPVEERPAATAKLLNAFAASMFHGPDIKNELKE